MSCCYLIVIGFKYFAVCYVLINCFIFFNYSFYVCFLVFYILLSILHVLFSRIVLCTVSPHVQFSIVVQFYRPLPPGGNSIAVNKYRRRQRHHHHHHVIQYLTFVICSLQVIQNRKFLELRTSVDIFVANTIN